MDTLAHGLWSYVVFHKHKYRWLGVLFGVLPDLLAFGPFFLLRLFDGTTLIVKPVLVHIPTYTYTIYNLTHSLVIFLAVFFLVFLLTKKWFVPLLGWMLHILIDIPTHTTAFFPTPYAWPFAAPPINGIRWSDPVFMIVNYLALFSVYFFLFYRKRTKLRKK